MHADVHVQNIKDSDDNTTPLTLNKTCSTADVDKFFAPADSLIDEEEDVVPDVSQDKPTVVD